MTPQAARVWGVFLRSFAHMRGQLNIGNDRAQVIDGQGTVFQYRWHFDGEIDQGGAATVTASAAIDN
jgi:hypothetical protein